MDGEDSPRRVLCPWRVHPLASTLPAVARATAGRLVRCEWLVGLAVCVLMGSASGFCVRCSPVRDSLEIGGPADSREPVAETPNDGRPAVWRAADRHKNHWLDSLGHIRHGLPATHISRSGRPSLEQRPARCWQEGAPWVRAHQGQSTRRGLSSPSMRLITSTTWLVDQATWHSFSSSWHRGCHLRPSRSGWP